MRFVLDANILARAAGSRNGPAGELFERILADHVLVVSLELLAELARVLRYDRVRRMHQLDDEEIKAFIESIESGGTLVSLPSPIPRVVPDDPDDDAVVATAVTGQVQVVCTRNRHLFHDNVSAYCRHRGFEIMDEIELLKRLREGEQESASR